MVKVHRPLNRTVHLVSRAVTIVYVSINYSLTTHNMRTLANRNGKKIV